MVINIADYFPLLSSFPIPQNPYSKNYNFGIPFIDNSNIVVKSLFGFINGGGSRLPNPTSPYFVLNNRETSFKKKHRDIKKTLQNVKDSIKVMEQYIKVRDSQNINTKATLPIYNNFSTNTKIIMMPSDEVIFKKAANFLKIGYQLSDSVDSIFIRIAKKNNEAIVYKKIKPLYIGMHFFNWDGKDASGNVVNPGLYNIKIFAKKGDNIYSIQPLVSKDAMRLN
ncbi:Basal-body rod modification protein FlgD [Buchnera aphidicola (Thelaxes suberi)]|uniref:FlgD immunoglobulin-like domain containing protein n=1 Tax=Buchnera aphidicola TaxID=9 RepID=UPI0034646F45